MQSRRIYHTAVPFAFTPIGWWLLPLLGLVALVVGAFKGKGAVQIACVATLVALAFGVVTIYSSIPK